VPSSFVECKQKPNLREVGLGVDTITGQRWQDSASMAASIFSDTTSVIQGDINEVERLVFGLNSHCEFERAMSATSLIPVITQGREPNNRILNLPI
jgi:hypothetical protein